MRIDDASATWLRFSPALSRDARLEQAFAEQVRGCTDLAVRVGYSILRCREDAEEVAQEAFARAYRHYQDLRDTASFRAWIVRTTWRLAIDRWRSNRRRQAREQKAAAAAEPRTAEQMAVESDRSARLWKAIEDLPDKLRIVIVLAAIEGHDVAEVARLLGVPEGTVKSRLFLARKGLGQRLRCLATDSGKR